MAVSLNFMDNLLKFALCRVKLRPLAGNGMQQWDPFSIAQDALETGVMSTRSKDTSFALPGDHAKFSFSGLGLLEYLTFFEDAGMEPIMAVWSGESPLTAQLYQIV